MNFILALISLGILSALFGWKLLPVLLLMYFVTKILIKSEN